MNVRSGDVIIINRKTAKDEPNKMTFEVVEDKGSKRFSLVDQTINNVSLSPEEVGEGAKQLANKILPTLVKGEIYVLSEDAMMSYDDLIKAVDSMVILSNSILLGGSKTQTTDTSNPVNAASTATNKAKNIRGKKRVITGKEYKKIDLEKEAAWFNSRFNIPLNIVQDIIENDAMGMFKDASVWLWEKAEEGTLYHEAFHVVYNLFLNKAQRNALIKEYKSRDGVDTSLNDLEIEEILAEEFRDYILSDGTLEIPKVEKQKKGFFTSLWNWRKQVSLASPKSQVRVRNRYKPDVTVSRYVTRCSLTLTSVTLSSNGSTSIS